MKLSGFGRGVVQRLVKTNVKRNLYFEIKEAVIEESSTSKRKALVKRYGLNTNAEIRSRLIELLYERVNYHKDKFICPTLYEEMSGMEVKRNGKVEHSDHTHDDQVFSYLMALYVWYEGRNIMENWNIMKNTIRTDSDEEILEGDIDRDSKTETVRLDECDIIGDDDVQMQMQYLNDPKRGMLTIQYNTMTAKSEEDELNYMMSTDQIFRKAYNDKYHNDNTTVGVTYNVDIPVSAFLDEDPEMEEAMRERQLHGNLYGQFLDL